MRAAAMSEAQEGPIESKQTGERVAVTVTVRRFVGQQSFSPLFLPPDASGRTTPARAGQTAHTFLESEDRPSRKAECELTKTSADPAASALAPREGVGAILVTVIAGAQQQPPGTGHPAQPA